jgi:hypothetical protein
VDKAGTFQQETRRRRAPPKLAAVQEKTRALPAPDSEVKASRNTARARKSISEYEPPNPDRLPEHPTTGEVVEPRATYSLSRLLNPKAYRRKGVNGALMPLTAKRILEIVGDTKVHIVDGAQMKRLMKGDDNVDGYYHPGMDHIVLNGEMVGGKAAFDQTVLHEAAHAALLKAIEDRPILKANLQDLADFAQKALAGTDIIEKRYAREVSGTKWEDSYGFSPDKKTGRIDIHEFLSEALSNPNFQRALSKIEIPNELAERLNVKQWRAGKRGLASVWDAVVAFARRAFKLPSSAHTALEAALASTDHVIDQRKSIQDMNRNMLMDELFGDVKASRNRFKDQITDAGNRVADTVGAADWRSRGRMARNYLSSLHHVGRRLDSFLGEKAGLGADLARGREAMRVMKQKILEMEGGDRVVEMLSALQRKYDRGDVGNKWRDMLGTLYEATTKNVDVFGNNAHITEGASDRQAWNAKDRLVKEFEAFNTKDTQDLYNGMKEAIGFFKRSQEQMAKDQIKAILETAGDKTLGLATRIYNNSLLEGEAERLQDNHILHALTTAREFKKLHGTYIPLHREGSHVVTAKQKVHAVPGSTLLPDGRTLQFVQQGKNTAAFERSVKEAIDKMGDVYDVADVKWKWVDKDGNLTEPQQADARKAAHVVINNEHTSFANGEGAAEKVRQDLIDSKKYETVSGVELKREVMNRKDSGLISNDMERIVSGIRGSEKFKSMSPEARELLIKGLHEASIRLLPGSRIQTHLLPRRNIAGHSTDLTRATAIYADQAAGYQARLRHMPKIEQGLKELEAYLTANRNQSTSVTAPRRELAQELERRIYGIDDNIRPNDTLNSVSRVLLKMSMLDKLGGVSFHIINSAEPWTTSMPMLAGEHGMGAAIKSMSQAYNAIGGLRAIGKGAWETGVARSQAAVEAHNAKAGKNGVTRMGNYIDLFKQNLAETSLSPDEKGRLSKLLDYLHDNGAMDKEAEFFIRRESRPESNRFERGLDQADLMARQMGGAIEGINRAVTGIAKYQLEHKKHGDHEKAMKAAYDLVSDTMGNYSASNSSPIFGGPVRSVVTQFHKYGAKMYNLLGQTAGAALDSTRDPAERKAAAKQLVGVLATHAVMAGALGLPIGPIKTAIGASNALLGTGFSVDDFEEYVREFLTKHLGKTGGEIAARGVPHAFGVDVSGRMGLDSLLMQDMPASNKPRDFKAWLADTMIGAAPQQVVDMIRGAGALAGVAKKAVTGREQNSRQLQEAAKVVPLKAFHDLTAAYFGATEGKKSTHGYETVAPYSRSEAVLRGVGFKPAREAETQEQNNMTRRADLVQHAEKGEFRDRWVAASPAERQKLWGEIERFNASRPAEARITRSYLDSQIQRRSKMLHNDTIYNGQQVRKDNRYIFDKSKRIYNTQ